MAHYIVYRHCPDFISWYTLIDPFLSYNIGFRALRNLSSFTVGLLSCKFLFCFYLTILYCTGGIFVHDAAGSFRPPDLAAAS